MTFRLCRLTTLRDIRYSKLILREFIIALNADTAKITRIYIAFSKNISRDISTICHRTRLNSMCIITELITPSHYIIGIVISLREACCLPYFPIGFRYPISICLMSGQQRWTIRDTIVRFESSNNFGVECWRIEINKRNT